MNRVIAIIKKNNETFYDYRSNQPVRIRGRIICISIAAFLFAIFVRGELEPFLTGVLTVQAILIGFSFSVLFFLITEKGEPDEREVAIEDQLKKDRLAKLSEELFHNISYFNLCAMASLVLAVLFLLPNISDQVRTVASMFRPEFGEAAGALYEVGRPIGAGALLFMLGFLVIESGYTFARTVGRVNYLFEQRLSAG